MIASNDLTSNLVSDLKNLAQKVRLQYLPVYITSWRNKAANMLTMTVQRGLNSAEKRGPLFEMDHACIKNDNADPKTPCI